MPAGYVVGLPALVMATVTTGPGRWHYGIECFAVRLWKVLQLCDRIRISRRPGVNLFTASLLALFVELVFIRWVPSVVHVVGFFANVVLIASFLGLGVGMMASDSRAPEKAAWRLLVAVSILSSFRILSPSVALDENTAFGMNEVVFAQGIRLPLPLVLVGVFALVAWTMIPFGRMVARPFDELERIPAYTVNIGGSLAGVALFTLASALGTPSIVWFAAALLLLLFRTGLKTVVPALVLTVVVLALVYYADTNGLEGEVMWSPYNQLRVLPVGADVDSGFIIDVNNQFLLSGLDLREGASRKGIDAGMSAGIDSLTSYYDFPFLVSAPESALILGAGAGNDVAAALRAGVGNVTAVEIDPRVAQFGAEHHPEHPYDAPGVQLFVDDARDYLRRSKEKFDLVLFATLDAHGLLSSKSSVRLDSFVYTTESLQEAAKLLSDDGVLVLSFGPFREEVQYRQYSMMEQVFGEPPAYFVHVNGHRALVEGAVDTIDEPPDGWRRIGPDEVAAAFERHPYARRAATDDWPHLYLRRPGIPMEYLTALLGMVIIGLLVVRRQASAMSKSDLPFFFLGAAFLLLETKSVTEFALLIGSTWQTNALVFTVILAIILIANLVVLRGFGGSDRLWMGVIAASLLAQHAWPVSVWPDLGPAGLPAAALYLGIPILAGGIVFARWLRGARVGSVALGVNLLGSVVGGTLEYMSLLAGIRALAIVALILYALAFVTRTIVSTDLIALTD